MLIWRSKGYLLSPNQHTVVWPKSTLSFSRVTSHLCWEGHPLWHRPLALRLAAHWHGLLTGNQQICIHLSQTLVNWESLEMPFKKHPFSGLILRHNWVSFKRHSNTGIYRHQLVKNTSGFQLLCVTRHVHMS